MAQEIGFDNITIDLIYGVPNQTIADWEKELDQMNQLNIPHLSAYCLTIEPNTVFGHRKQKGDLALPTDREYLSFFNLLIKKTAEANMEHYEISNFAKSGYVSQHNSAYWRGKPYLGIGPSAHSFDGKNRSWNIANNFKYMAAIEKNESCRELEVLKTVDRFNDYLITRLRTKWGIDRAELNQISANYYADITPTLNQLLKDEKLMEEDGIINLTPKGLFISDAILEDLFCLEESD
jgi:oxygen-independent coproporphyrinogen-3 oxidase